MTINELNREYKLDFIYDANSKLIGLTTIQGNYFYVRDVIGNIIGIIDSNGNYVIKYKYDAWGNLLSNLPSIDDNTVTIAAKYNPFMYKGYYYDVETGWFWLSSRYYSPELCRFISPADVSSLNPSSINGLNLYSYANYNPINITYSGSSGGGSNGGGMINSLALSGISSGGRYLLGSSGLFVKLPSQDGISLGIDFAASMSGALSVFGWTLKNPEFYEFWYSALGISKYEMLSNLKSPMTKIASFISYGLVAYDTYTDVMRHINAGDSWQKTTASGMVTAGVGAFNVWASAKVGAAVGSAIGGVPGFIIGTAAGVVLGIVIYGIFYTEINGKSIAGHIEDGIEWFLEWIS